MAPVLRTGTLRGAGPSASFAASWTVRLAYDAGVKHRSPPTALHRTAVWIAGLLVAASLVPAAADAPVRIGVLAYLGGEYSVDEWAATVRVVETALPNRRVELLPMDHDGLTRAVADGGVDFVITNPGHYVELETGYGISRIATARVRHAGGVGGVRAQ